MNRVRATKRQRDTVIARARHCCEYCRAQQQFSDSPFAIEHIQPVAKGGLTAVENLALACGSCNGHKSTHTTGHDPETGANVPLFHPRRQKWQEHFAWNTDCTIVQGLTPTGRATLAKLQLNREELVNLRRVLYLAGLHPPPTND